MRFDSLWSNTKTFFPLLYDFLKCEPEIERKSGCVIGAADGKFVFPLASLLKRVVAIEVDEVMVYGGDILSRNNDVMRHHTIGMNAKLAQHGFINAVEIYNLDFADFVSTGHVDLAFTSCSWHYSLNAEWGHEAFITKMQSLLRPGGIFCAEYMMPCAPEHVGVKRYLSEGQILKFFERDWSIHECFYTHTFHEEGHVGNIRPHTHKMGFFLARKK